ncbi:MAG: hypothetical protein ACREIA_11575 [Opitutaceae bacterium]
MRFLLDHDVAADVAMILRQRGHDIVELRTVLPPNTPGRRCVGACVCGWPDHDQLQPRSLPRAGDGH